MKMVTLTAAVLIAVGGMSMAPQGVSTAKAGELICPFAKKPAPKKHRNWCPAPAAAVRVAPARVVVAAPPPTPVVVYPGPGSAPMIYEYGDPFAMQAARDGCPLVNDAIGPLETFADGQMRYRWRGTDWAYMPPQPDPKSRLCTRNGHLSWWTPPKPRSLTQPGAQPPAAPSGQQGMTAPTQNYAFAPMR